MVGDWDEGSGCYGKFFETGCLPKSPQLVVRAVEADVRQCLGSQGLGSPLIECPSVAGTMGQILMCQGAKIEGARGPAFIAAAETIVKMVTECKTVVADTGHKSNVSETPEKDELIQSLQVEVAALKIENKKYEGFMKEVADENYILKTELEKLRNQVSVLGQFTASFQSSGQT